MRKSFALRAQCRQDVCAPSQAWRVFCAIELPEVVRQQALQHIVRLKEAMPDAHASWSRAENIHLTLKFLGDVPKKSVEKLSEAAAQAVVSVAPFTIRLEQTGVFPLHGSPRVLWIGVTDGDGKLGELHQRLETESEIAGFTRESRRFHPHLTIARLRKPQPGSPRGQPAWGGRHARALASAHKATEFKPAEIAVSELLVIRSELSSAGSKYTTISRHLLTDS